MEPDIKNAETKLEILSSDAETIALYRAREACKAMYKKWKQENRPFALGDFARNR